MSLNSLIVGPGAIGALACQHAQNLGRVAAYRHRAGINLPKTLTRDHQETQLNWSLEAAPPSFIPELIWVCTKAFNAEHAARTLIARYPKATIILLHNGLGPQEAIRKLTPDRCIWGSTTCGAYQHKNQHYTQTLGGKTSLGCPPDTSETAESMILLDKIVGSPSALNVHKSDDIEFALWRKMAINAVINPITALYQTTNGVLIKPEFNHAIASLCAEIEAIGNALGFKSCNDPVEAVLKVASLTDSNRSSMAEDIRLHRKTEIEFINGYLISKAKLLGLPSAHLNQWYQRIKNIENV
ncbi:MAG TPA: 2-dehydropantoate 2-reductase [Marinagarivorans sp.]